MRLVQNKYRRFKIILFKKIVVCLLAFFIAKPIFIVLNNFFDNSDEISFLMIENESLEDENSEEELEEIEESDKFLLANIDVILFQELQILFANSIENSSLFEHKLIDPPPEFIV